MIYKIVGKEGEYVVKNSSSILQYKVDKNGNFTGESVMHITTDSIENTNDRREVTEKLKDCSSK